MVHDVYKPSLKDEHISNFGPDCQMWGPLAQWVVLNVVVLVPQPCFPFKMAPLGRRGLTSSIARNHS